MINLDYKCMEYAQKILKSVNNDEKKVKELEKILRKALGVLREDGVYAMFLWLEYKDKDRDTRKKLIDLLNEKEIKKYLLQDRDSSFSKEDFKEFCEELKKVAEVINKLFFMKKILERTLTYALYHAKVKGENNVGEA